MPTSSTERQVGVCQVVRRERHPPHRAQPEQRPRRSALGEMPVVMVFGKTDEAREVMEPTREDLKCLE